MSKEMNNRKKIMILGGNTTQMPLIEEAKEAGYYTIVCDMRDNVPGVLAADKHYQIDFTKYKAVISAAKKENIDGIISNSETAMLNVARVSTELGLPGNSPESIEALLSKSKFRELQKKAGVFAIEHYLVSSLDELLSVANNMKYPIIVKPAECSGTRGTTKLEQFDRDKLHSSFMTCLEYSRNDLVEVEEYVEMSSLRVNDADIFVIEGEILWDGTLWEDRAETAPMLPMTEIFPMVLDEDKLNKIKQAVENVIKTSGVKHGEFNVETYFTKNDEVFIIEINPRQAGNYIPLLIKEHNGVNLTKLLVTTAVGDMSYYQFLKNYKRRCNFITCQVVFAKKDGIYNGIYIDEELKPYVQWIKEEVVIGEYVKKGINAGEALAFIDFRFDSYEIQHKYTDNIEQYVYAKVL